MLDKSVWGPGPGSRNTKNTQNTRKIRIQCWEIQDNKGIRNQYSVFRTECDIRTDFDRNEYPNIFVSRKWHEQISEYICMKITNEYLNIFVLKFWHERISKYIRIQKSDTNEYPNIFVSKKWYERIPE